MKYTELSIEKLKSECNEWAKELKKTYCPDLVIYVARAGYLIGKEMSEVFEVPMVGISATREGNKLKEIVGPVISLMPNFVRNFLISIELKSNTHDKNTERKIHFHESLKKLKGQSFDHILVVDDSVDTGHSMKQVVDAIQNEFKSAEIKIAGLNVWDKSKNIIHTNFALYENTVIKAPMSKDSSEYKEFVRIYNEETKEGAL